jgi:hypothetical protein
MSDETTSAPPLLHASVMARLGAQDAADPRRVVALRLAVRRAAAWATVVAAATVGGLLRWRARAVPRPIG